MKKKKILNSFFFPSYFEMRVYTRYIQYKYTFLHKYTLQTDNVHPDGLFSYGMHVI